MGFAETEHVLVRSYDSDGKPTESVERCVETGDGRVGWWLPDAAGVAERFAAAPVVSVQACTSGGKPILDQPVLEGRAEVVADGPLFNEIKDRIHAKYKVGSGLAGLVDRTKEVFGGKTPECAVAVTIVG